jgi:hypothetical protein
MDPTVSFSEIMILARFIDMVQQTSLTPIVVKLPIHLDTTDEHRFVYQFSRLMAFRSNGGRLKDESNETCTVIKPCLAVVCPSEMEQQIKVVSPFLSLAEADGELVFDEPLVVNVNHTIVIKVSIKAGGDCEGFEEKTDNNCSKYSSSMTLVLSSRGDDENPPPNPCPTRSLVHNFESSRFTLIPSPTFELTSSIKIAFFSSMSIPFGPDVDVLKYLTPHQMDKGFHKKLVLDMNTTNGSSSIVNEKPTDVSNMTVWTAPSSAGTVQYYMAILRLCGMRPDVLKAIMPLLMDKVVYLRNTSANLRAEV